MSGTKFNWHQLICLFSLVFFLFYVLLHTNTHRLVQLSQSWFAFQTWIQLLPDPDIYSMLHVGYRFMGLLLAWPERHPCSGVTGCDNIAHHGHLNIGHQFLIATRQLYQSHRCMDRCLFDIRFWRLAWVCPSELRVAQWCSSCCSETAASRLLCSTQMGPWTCSRTWSGSHRWPICINICNGKWYPIYIYIYIYTISHIIISYI